MSRISTERGRIANVIGEHRFAAMGTHVHVVVRGEVTAGCEELCSLAEDEVRRLESKWSRFLPDSEVSRLNQNRGVPNIVSAETFALVERAVEGHRITHGAFDASLLDAIEGLGYDRDFDEIAGEVSGGPHRDASDGLPRDASVAAAESPPRDLGFTLEPELCAVTLAPGSGFDPGGIGKGLAADLVSKLVLENGALGVLVNLGGDMRAAGAGPLKGWLIEVENPLDAGGGALAAIRLWDGALATSTSYKRRWRRRGEAMHHLLDADTGRPAESDIAAVTVLDAEAWRAEVICKAVFVAGREAGFEILEETAASGFVVGHDGTLRASDACAELIEDVNA